MNKCCVLSLLFFLGACVSCKSSSSSEVSQNQTNDQNQVQNESTLDCNRVCSISPTGLVSVSVDCQGGASSVIVVEALPDNCTSINQEVTTVQGGV